MLVVLAMIAYIGRQGFGALRRPIQAKLGLSEELFNLAYLAFPATYGLFAIPLARRVDQWGTRLMLTLIALWWSASMLASAAVGGLASLVALRLICGAGEAGLFPSISRTLSLWVPYRNRGTAQGAVFCGGHLAAFLTPLLVGYLIDHQHWSWRTVFLAFGMIGLAWALLWAIWFRDTPEQHAGVNALECDTIALDRHVPQAESPHGWRFWRHLITHRNMIAIALMYMPNSIGFYFCLTWLGAFLKDSRGMQDVGLNFFIGLPFAVAIAPDLCGGLATDMAVKYFGPRWGRAFVGMAAYIVGGVALLAAAVVHQPQLAGALVAGGIGFNMFLIGPAWGTCQDVGGRHPGVVSATMNSSGQFGVFFATLAMPVIHARLGWDWAVAAIGISFMFGAACWLFIDPRDKVFE